MRVIGNCSYIPNDTETGTSSIWLIGSSHHLLGVLALVDVLISLTFLFDYLMNMCGVDNVYSYALSSQGIADFLSSVPFSVIGVGKSVNTFAWPSIIRTLKMIKVTTIPPPIAFTTS